MIKYINYQVILAAKAGDPKALAEILQYYAAYISAHSRRTYFDEYGNQYEYIDEEIRQRIESKLMYMIMTKFDPFEYPQESDAKSEN